MLTLLDIERQEVGTAEVAQVSGEAGWGSALKVLLECAGDCGYTRTMGTNAPPCSPHRLHANCGEEPPKGL